MQEKIEGVVILILFIGVLLWIGWETNSSKAVEAGFINDVNDYLDTIDDAESPAVLEGLEKSLRILREEYKKDVRPDVLNQACARIQAAIKNKHQKMINQKIFLTEA